LIASSEVAASGSGLVSGAVTRSQEIADAVAIDLDLGRRHFPGFEVPAGRTASEELRRLCLEGLRDRYAGVAKRWEAGVAPPAPLAVLPAAGVAPLSWEAAMARRRAASARESRVKR
jgi:DNA polymerase III alpha subunit